MRFWLKLFLGYFAIIALGTYLFMNAMLEEIKPGLRQSMETSLVDTANLLAEIIAPADNHSLIDTEALATAVSATLKRPINATIWNHTQRQTQLRVYATNQKGIVIYDSQARDLGKDYSQWNDVYLTLRGNMVPVAPRKTRKTSSARSCTSVPRSTAKTLNHHS